MAKNLQTKFSTRQYMLSRDFEIYYYNEPVSEKVSVHSHDYYEFYFFLEGDVSILIEGKQHPLKYGDMVLIPPSIKHMAVVHGNEIPYRRFVFWISVEYCNQLMEVSSSYGYLMQNVLVKKKYIFHNDLITFNTIQYRIFQLIEEIKSERFGKEAKVSLCVNDLVLQLNRIVYEQQNLEQLDSHFLTKDARKKHKIIGQLFDTYWLIEYEDKLFIIDQHDAHEKVLYERTMKKISDKNFSSQTISPPIILTLSNDEVQALETYAEQLSTFGYEIEPFGGKEYAITAIPADFTDIDMKTMFIEMLDDFANISGKDAPNLIIEKSSSMSCKAAVKGNNHLSRPEIESLIDELLELDNPYNCPNGRPTIISMTKYEIEKKFRRIV